MNKGATYHLKLYTKKLLFLFFEKIEGDILLEEIWHLALF